MEFVVIILFVAAIVLVNFLVGRVQRRRAGRPDTPKAAVKPAQGTRPAGRAPAGASLETSREAVSRLDEAGHRQVYAAIAQGQPIRAIQVYAQLTGCGLRAASAAVASLASHPVPFTRPAPNPGPAADATGSDAAAEPVAGSAPESAGEESGKDGAAPDAADKDAAASGTPGRGAEKRNNSQTLPDEAEISKWAQNLRPEDF